MKNMRLTKIKVKDKFILLRWEKFESSTKNWDIYELESADPPRPELREELEKWSAHIAKICELPEEYAKRITVRGISISYTEDGLGIVASGTMELKTNAAPLCINTPYKPDSVGENMSEDFALTGEQWQDLDDLCEEAYRYINGDRAQQNLFSQEEKNENNSDTESERRSGENYDGGELGVPALH